jgi:hypothetical protein
LDRIQSLLNQGAFTLGPCIATGESPVSRCVRAILMHVCSFSYTLLKPLHLHGGDTGPVAVLLLPVVVELLPLLELTGLRL